MTRAPIRVADYVTSFLAERGVDHVFLVTGGGSMHLNDAIGRTPGLAYVACHHEQAAAIAAESYCRLSNRVAAVNVTTGPGGTNAITGVFGAWVDSIAMFVVSGQVKRETTVAWTGLPLRQVGDQEAPIIPLVQPITKYAAVVDDPADARYHCERAWHEATSGRPGPVWLDIPGDVQGALVDPEELRGFQAPTGGSEQLTESRLADAVAQVFDHLARAERPVILAGAGVRISGRHDAFVQLCERLGLPVLTAFNAHDAIWNDFPFYVGRPGIVGDRAGNFALQNADFVLVLGSRLSIRQVSYAWDYFARSATIAMVDIDAAELAKPTLKVELPILADLAEFLPMAAGRPWVAPPAHREYLDWCLERRRTYPVVLPEHRVPERAVNPYYFVEQLFERLPENEIVVTGDGTACVVTFQAAHLRPGQRLYHNSGSAPMGYDLPATVGAAVASGRRVICITGDGSIQMNLAELATMRANSLEVKLFLLNNRGYHSIRQTQNNYFPDNPVGCGEESGLFFPDMAKIAAAYGMGYAKATTNGDIGDAIDRVLREPGSQILELFLDLDQQFSPKLASRRLPDGRMVSPPLEDMWPFLDRAEFRNNMIIDPIET